MPYSEPHSKLCGSSSRQAWGRIFRFGLWPSATDGRRFRLDPLPKRWVWRSLLSFVVSRANALFVLQVLLVVVRMIATIALLERLASALDTGATALAMVALLLLTIAQFALSLAEDLLALAVEKRVLDAVAGRLGRARTNADRAELLRILGRDLELTVEWSSQLQRLFSIPLCVLVVTAYLVVRYGAQQLWVLLGIAAFVPIAGWLGRLGAGVVRDVMQQSALRIEQVERWVRWAPYLLNWRAPELLNTVARGLRLESNLRNRDSVIRSAEPYLVQLGRVLPIVLLLVLAHVTGHGSNIDIVAFWLVAPVLALILEFGRLYAELEQSRISFAAVGSILASADATSQASHSIELTDDWEIWEGTVAENLPLCSPATVDALTRLGLTAELGATLERTLEKRLEPGGANISAGQRTRLLIARAVGLAHGQKRMLIPSLSLASLDYDNAERAKQLLDEARNPDTSESPLPAFTHAAPEDPHAPGDIAPTDIAPATAISIRGSNWHPAAVAFVFPALLAGLAGSWVADEHLRSRVSSSGVLGLVAIGVATALLAGWLIERRIRRDASRQMIESLRRAPLYSDADLVQRGSKDLTTVLERVAWYTHDISWIGALILVASFGASASLGAWGGCIVIAALLLTMVFWRRLVPVVVSSRKTAIAANDALLRMGVDLRATNHLLAAWSDGANYRTTRAKKTLEHFFVSRAQMVLSKGSLARWVDLVSLLAIVALTWSLTLAHSGTFAAAFVLTSALTVNGYIVQLLLALAGYRAQRICMQRLQPRPVLDSSAPSFTVTDAAVESKRLVNPRLNIEYGPISFERGCLQSVTGSSGEGKTQLLRTLVGFGQVTASSHQGGYYVDAHWGQAVKAGFPSPITLHKLLETFDNPVLVVLDEATTTLSEDQAAAETSWLEQWAARGNIAVVLVDHRLRTRQAIEFSRFRREPRRPSTPLEGG